MAERNDDRPSPEALLEEARRAGRGKLKIFLGAAPGVGKTYAMLRAAQLRRREGVDLVVGVVETHGRRETEALLRGLEIIPRREIDYRGVRFHEMDLDALLARRPQLALVDELAHTNVPGCRHPKRYQDVEELLDAGIDVYSTVNIQHLESLNDIVTRIAGIRVRETLPDSVLQAADEIELIDLAPEELLQRLREGKVYVPDQARRAIQHFFSPGNLTALRELALRHAAERVDEQMLTYMRAHAIPGPWPTRERIMVLVGDDPVAPRLVRTAKRAAERRQAPWLAVHVETYRHQALDEAAKDRISAALRLAEQLGGETATLTGEHIVDEVIACARARNVSQIIVGKSRRSRLVGFLQRSVTDELLARSDTFDVLVVTAGEAEAPPKPVHTEARRERLPWLGYAAAAGAVTATAGVAWLAAAFLPVANLSLIFLLAVLLVATRFGLWPSIVASVLSLLAYNVLFTAPMLSFTVAKRQDILTIGFFLLVAVITSNLAARLRRQVEATKLNARRTANLYDFSRKIAGAAGLDDVLWAVVHHVAATLQGRALVLLPQDDRLEIMAGYPPEDQLDTASAAAADWAWRQGKPAGRGSSTLPSAQWLFLPLRTARGPVGILGVQMEGPDRLLSPEQGRLLETLADQAAVAIERTTLVSDIEEARILTETERLRSALLSSISHDLRTPLVSIMGSVTSLMSYWTSFDERTRLDLLQTIQDEAERLNRFVQNLLDMTRLGSGALHPKCDWVELQDIIGSALERLKKQTASREIVLEIEPDLPLLNVDFVLIEQVLINILDNACKYSPPDGSITIRARREPARVVLEVCDQGPGIPEAERERVFDMFYRVKATDGQDAGTGLGLAICRGIVEAHDGTVAALPGLGGRGTCIVVTLPATEPPLLPDLSDGAADGADAEERRAEPAAAGG